MFLKSKISPIVAELFGWASFLLIRQLSKFPQGDAPPILETTVQVSTDILGLVLLNILGFFFFKPSINFYEFC